MGTGTLFPVVKRQEREADHYPSGGEVKNVWKCTSSPPYGFMAWCLIKHRGNLSLAWRSRASLWTWRSPARLDKYLSAEKSEQRSCRNARNIFCAQFPFSASLKVLEIIKRKGAKAPESLLCACTFWAVSYAVQKPLASSTNKKQVFVCKKYVKLRESSSKLFVLQGGFLFTERRREAVKLFRFPLSLYSMIGTCNSVQSCNFHDCTGAFCSLMQAQRGWKAI
jgi:hypothetical protein